MIHKSSLFVIFLLAISFIFSSPLHAQTYKVKIKEYGFADLTVKFKDFGVSDETWKVKGACSSSFGATSIKAKEFGVADLTVKIKTFGVADKTICITNPDDLPDWFLEMID